MSENSVNYYDGINVKLLEAIPHDAKRVLELGCAKGLLGQKFKERHPGVYWHGIDISADAAQHAASVLDQVDVLDLDAQDLVFSGEKFDTIVMGDLLEHLKNPTRVLDALYEITKPDACVVCCVPNMSHYSVLQRMVAGDISYDRNGLLDQTHLRFYSPSSLFKLLLDSGWIPNMKDHYSTDLPQSALTLGLIEAAKDMGLPPATAARNLSLYQMIVVGRKWRMDVLRKESRKVPFSVIVPVNRPWQCDLNILRSPGLKEAGIPVVCVESAQSAADAFQKGLPQTQTPWVILAHQDMYFPSGTGVAIAAELAAIEDAGLAGTPVGFAGVAVEPNQDLRYAGWVVDRLNFFQHPASGAVVSLDELAVALHRNSKIQIDPRLGWHLWATDLCLQAEQHAQRPIAQVLEVPIFHNSFNDFTLPESFHQSAKILRDKYPQKKGIMTLCGLIE